MNPPIVFVVGLPFSGIEDILGVLQELGFHTGYPEDLKSICPPYTMSTMGPRIPELQEYVHDRASEPGLHAAGHHRLTWVGANAAWIKGCIWLGALSTLSETFEQARAKREVYGDWNEHWNRLNHTHHKYLDMNTAVTIHYVPCKDPDINLKSAVLNRLDEADFPIERIKNVDNI